MENTTLSAVLQKIATGPHLSKNLSIEEAYSAMQTILSGDAHEVQSAIFFIALRMKRETADEMTGIFRAILDAAPTQKVQVPTLFTLADQYAGYARGLPASPFIPAVLSALNLPSVTHSPVTMSPKYGLTVLSVLKAAGVRSHDTLASAANTLENNSGWVVLDQALVHPALAALNGLRDLMVKRACLSTIECCVHPLQSVQSNTLVTGYVHKPYPPIYAMCADIAGFDKAVFVRGVEGGTVPSLAQISRYFPWQRSTEVSSPKVLGFDEITLNEVPVNPSQLGIDQQLRAVPWPEVDVSDHDSAARMCAALGMQALQGERGLMRDAIRLGSAVAIAGHMHPIEDMDNAGQHALMSAMKSVDVVLESGQAWQCFDEQRKI